MLKYLIVDKYDNECYIIYGKGIYDTLTEAKKDWKIELKTFFEMGPDDSHHFSLVKINLTPSQLDTLQKHIDKFNMGTSEEYGYNEEFISFMTDHVDVYKNAVYGPEGYDGYTQIIETAEANGEDAIEDETVFNKYFTQYYKEIY